MICFDMDGTIADLYGVEGWLDKLRKEDPSPYLMAPPLWDMARLKEILTSLSAEGWEIRVISWLAKGSSDNYKRLVREAKLAWLEMYDFPADKVHLIQYGTTKADCVRRWANPAILVDDDSRIRKGWTLGETINPLDGDLLERLEKLLSSGRKTQ